MFTNITHTIVKSTSAPPEISSMRLSDNDVVMPRTPSQICFVYDNVTADEQLVLCDRMKSSLATLLGVYPEMCGELKDEEKGNITVVFNNVGVKWTTQTATDDLINNLWFAGTPRFQQQLTPDGLVTPDPAHIMTVTFTCMPSKSTVIIGASTHHCIADGSASFTFKQSWAQLTNGTITVDECRHSLDRSAVYGGMPKEMPVRPKEYTDKLDITAYTSGAFTAKNIRIPRATIERVRSTIVKELGGNVHLSENDVLCGMIWSKATKARCEGSNVSLDTPTNLGIAVNGRSRLGLSKDYVGNVNLFAMSESSFGDILEDDQNAVKMLAQKVRSNVSAMTKERVTSILDWVSLQDNKKEIHPAFSGGVFYEYTQWFIINAVHHFAMTNWTSFPIYDVCFPSVDHRPIKAVLPAKAFNSLAIVFPCPTNDEVEVVIGLLEVDIEKLNLEF